MQHPGRLAAVPVLLTLALTAGAALAQPCTSDQIPDILVGDISSIINYPTAGAEDAVGFGHTLCNVGNTTIQCSPAPALNHPILTQNLYRFQVIDGAGRFEQIGMGWVSHEFSMLSGTLCCTNCSPTAGLGPHCSSPTSANIASTQGTMRPRFEVDAATAAFPSMSFPQPISSTMDRRLRFLSADAPVPGARYFAEKIVLAPDDGVRSDNVSNREVSVTVQGSDRTFNLSGATHRDQPAVLRWAELDPNVHVSSTDVPGDGRLWLLSRATPLLTGLWHYEYLLFNQDSHRSVGSLFIARVANAGNPPDFLNPGFHDVSYHSGDGPGYVNYAATDWSVTGPGDWRTEPAATNPGANAIRWATAYNFRFDSSFPPAPTDSPVILGLWLPGTPAQAVLSAVAPARCNDIDFNNDGLFPDTRDIDDLLSSFAGGPCDPPCDTIDFNNDGLFPDTLDIEAFLSVFSGGPCP
ncbi:MAG: hypothetical protein U0637_12670 [Phycisphaerales bacterium]